MALDQINLLVAVTQMKASDASDEALQSQPKPRAERRTGFDTYTKAVSETFSTTLATADLLQTQVTTGGTKTAQKSTCEGSGHSASKREVRMMEILTRLLSMMNQMMKEKAANFRA